MCALHYKSKLVMKSRIDCSIDHCDGVLSSHYFHVSSCDISILGAVVVTVSSPGWPMDDYGRQRKREHWVRDKREQVIYTGAWEPGGGFWAILLLWAPLPVPLAGATEGLNYPVQIWHGYYYVGCWEYTSPSESVDREISSEASGENGMQAVSQKPGTGK